MFSFRKRKTKLAPLRKSTTSSPGFISCDVDLMPELVSDDDDDDDDDDMFSTPVAEGKKDIAMIPGIAKVSLDDDDDSFVDDAAAADPFDNYSTRSSSSPLSSRSSVESSSSSSLFMDDSSSSSSSDDGESDDDSSDDVDAITKLELFYKEQLKNQIGFLIHLSGDIVHRSHYGRGTLLTRVSNFFSWYNIWIQRQRGSSDCDLSCEDLLYRFVKKDYALLSNYYEYLVKKKEFKASTILNYQEDILVVFQWFAYFRTATTSMSDDDKCLEINPHDFAALMLMMDRMRIAYKKKRRVEKADGPACIEDLQDEGKWPTNGFKDLNRAIMKDVKRWEIVFLNPEELRITKPLYNNFMRLLCASFYGTSIQGRINGIRNLTIKEAKKIIQDTDDVPLISKFKTSRSFGYQPITSSVVVKFLIKMYLLHIRPVQFDNSVDALLMVNWKQRRLDVGKCVTKFFKRHLGLHITTNRIRSIVESSTEQLHVEGSISSTDRASVLAVNGHCSTTMKRHYLKRSRIQDAANVRSVVAKMCPNKYGNRFSTNLSEATNGIQSNEVVLSSFPSFSSSPTLNIMANQSITVGSGQKCFNKELDVEDGVVATAPGHAPAYVDEDEDDEDDDDDDDDDVKFEAFPQDSIAGHLHPDTEKVKGRVPWTRAELEYVGRYGASHPEMKNKMANCLKAIKKDPKVLALFHPHHIEDSTRLRYAWEKYKEEKDF